MSTLPFLGQGFVKHIESRKRRSHNVNVYFAHVTVTSQQEWWSGVGCLFSSVRGKESNHNLSLDRAEAANIVSTFPLLVINYPTIYELN
jgi:hypothetical protein